MATEEGHFAVIAKIESLDEQFTSNLELTHPYIIMMPMAAHLAPMYLMFHVACLQLLFLPSMLLPLHTRLAKPTGMQKRMVLLI
jgi:hypothetical protein